MRASRRKIRGHLGCLSPHRKSHPTLCAFPTRCLVPANAHPTSAWLFHRQAVPQLSMPIRGSQRSQAHPMRRPTKATAARLNLLSVLPGLSSPVPRNKRSSTLTRRIDRAHHVCEDFCDPTHRSARCSLSVVYHIDRIGSSECICELKALSMLHSVAQRPLR